MTTSVSLEDLQAGDILNEDVRDISGRLVLSKGQEIDVQHIRLLRIWGIPEVRVQEPNRTTDVKPCEKEIDKRLQSERTVQTIFQNIDIRHPAIDAVFQAAIEYRYQHALIIESLPRQGVPEHFKLDLSNGLMTQIAFSEVQLPESPEIIESYSRTVEDPSSSINDIAEVVGRSPSLAAIVLKIANSAMFGFTTRIDTLSRAVTLLGTREVGALVSSISIMRLFQGIPETLIDMRAFLRHSLACGILSRILGAGANRPQTERLFVAGLLHDLGRLVLYRYFPEQAKLLLDMARATGLTLYELENECLGIRHTQIAGLLLKKWNLPAPLVDAIVHHHRPSRSPDPVAAGIVHVADIAINALGLGSSGEQLLARFESRTWDQVPIPATALKTAIGQTVAQLEIMEALFAGL